MSDLDDLEGEVGEIIIGDLIIRGFPPILKGRCPECGKDTFFIHERRDDYFCLQNFCDIRYKQIESCEEADIGDLGE